MTSWITCCSQQSQYSLWGDRSGQKSFLREDGTRAKISMELGESGVSSAKGRKGHSLTQRQMTG